MVLNQKRRYVSELNRKLFLKNTIVINAIFLNNLKNISISHSILFLKDYNLQKFLNYYMEVRHQNELKKRIIKEGMEYCKRIEYFKQ